MAEWWLEHEVISEAELIDRAAIQPDGSFSVQLTSYQPPAVQPSESHESPPEGGYWVHFSEILPIPYLFSGGPAPINDDAADADEDGQLDVTDAVRLLDWVIGAGVPPEAPFPDPGYDLTADTLGTECDGNYTSARYDALLAVPACTNRRPAGEWRALVRAELLRG